MKRILLSLALLGFAQSAGGVFGPPVPLDVGPGSGEILVADLNRDGNPDIVTKHLLQHRITVSVGDGAGRFTRGEGSIVLPFGPGAVSLGETNGDGIPDLLLAARYADNEFAGVYPGDGRGGFTKRALVRVHEATRFYKPMVVEADINRDGRMDLVTSNGRRSTIQILMGDGRGRFAAPIDVQLEPNRDFHTFALGDFDGDARLDLVSASTIGVDGSGRVEVALGNGAGQFRRQPPVEESRGPRVEAAADLDADGDIDVVVSHAAPQLTVLLNDGRGRLTRAAGSPLALPFETHAVIAQDLNADGRVDLAAATRDSISVLLNDGRGFGAASSFRAGPGAFQLAAADLNRDRRLDLVGSSFEGSALTLLFGK
jgi:hypothetical protein